MLQKLTNFFLFVCLQWANIIKSVGNDGVEAPFRHPFLQAWGMFMGESLCIIVYYIQRCLKVRKANKDQLLPKTEDGSAKTETHPAKTEDPEAFKPADEELEDDEPRNFNPFLFFPPSMLDLVATSLMYLGLTLTSASSFQMLRGAVIIFTGLFSRCILGHQLAWSRWAGILIVFAGLVTVGLTDHFMVDPKLEAKSGDDEVTQALSEEAGPKNDVSDVVIGDVLIVIAQVLVALQVVFEEKYVAAYNVSFSIIFRYEILCYLFSVF